ncbi:MAG TPA: alpha/beta fold hydrolase [Gaiellaceae bacterium]|jgi:pimeloyl-ACP methyl ester carboxylesterase
MSARAATPSSLGSRRPEKGGPTKLFDDPLHDEFACWPLGLLEPDGGAVGEVAAIAASVTSPDDDAFVAAWLAAADRHMRGAEDAEKAGHTAHARGHYLRAASFYEVAIHVLYGTPVDRRLSEAFDRLTKAFDRAMSLEGAEALSIPFDGHTMPGYFLRADGAAAGEKRPVVICVNGYDATMADMYLAQAIDACRWGYHCVLFDGPGQGSMLVRDGLALVPDWERVVTPVVDAALERGDVDPDKVVLQGWSLGGYLAARAATAEHRLAACILDPPLWSMFEGMPRLVRHLGLSEKAVAALPEISDEDEATLMKVIDASPGLRWKIVQRGFWVNGVVDLRGYMASCATYTLDGRAGEIRCPTLATRAEDDLLAAGAEEFLGRLTCPTTLVRFGALEGAGDHCELQNRWLANQRILDWLDDIFA